MCGPDRVQSVLGDDGREPSPHVRAGQPPKPPACPSPRAVPACVGRTVGAMS